MSYCKNAQKKYIISYKTSVGEDMKCNVLTSVLYYIALYLFFFNLHKLVLSTTKVLYFQKSPVVGTLQK